MKQYIYDVDGVAEVFVDDKRALWSLSVLYALFPLLGIALHAWTGYQWLLLAPLLLSYLVAPIVDWLVGEDTSNPPEVVVKALEDDWYYRALTMLTVPLHFVSLIAAAYWASSQSLHPLMFVALAVTAGLGSGLGINTAHELGHKKTRLEQWLARIVLAVPAYGHFCIEHNRGHHRDVATPEDPASSRMGESIYRFALREIPGAMKRGWQVEKDRLTRKGVPVFSWQNELLQSYAISAVLQLGLLIGFGWLMIPFLIIHNVLAWWQLTSANYIEHYGLLRQRQANGRYERCEPYHSWNSNHRYSNLLLFHLQRHSDHHAHPTRRYQSLRNFDNVPRLPNGYFGMYLAAYVPPVWYKIMDKRLLALPHIAGDLSQVNIDPASQERIVREFAASTES
ncbi:MAG: alkane 1-monooxygenase [Pseudomonadota bacterium]